MTSNQIAYQQHLETVRSNVSRETETNRSNLAKEAETHRSNVANESENIRYHNLTTEETKRSNLAKEAETKRHNLFGESLESNKLEETKRANRVNEAETQRSHVAQESIGATQASASYLAAQSRAMEAATHRNESNAKIPLIMAQVGTETQKSINFGSSTKLNLARVNESRANTQLTDAKRKTENQQRLPGTIGKWVDVGTKAISGALSGVKLFGG